ncbi:hypothetical protein PFISCL1PPCAC_7328, partial [Pristionchus fissidentatus]
MAFHDNATYMYIQMELCTLSLANWLSNNSTPRNLERMKLWLKQLVEAVDYIHSKKFMHRDLNPNNILLLGEDQLKICDLGTATEIGTVKGVEVTRTRTAIGTELYESPEQRTWKYRSKVDVFTLGLIFAELCLPMTAKAKRKIFDNYRNGRVNVIFRDQPAVGKFVSWLAQVDHTMRPTCREILNSPFLAQSCEGDEENNEISYRNSRDDEEEENRSQSEQERSRSRSHEIKDEMLDLFEPDSILSDRGYSTSSEHTN